MRKKGTEQEVQILQLFAHTLIGVLVGFVVCFLSLAVFSLALSNGILQESQMKMLTMIACLLSGGAGGWTAAGRSKSARLLTGLMTGGGLFLMIVTTGTLLYRSVINMQDALLLLGGFLCGGALSGILAGQGSQKRKANRGKRKRH